MAYTFEITNTLITLATWVTGFTLDFCSKIVTPRHCFGRKKERIKRSKCKSWRKPKWVKQPTDNSMLGCWDKVCIGGKGLANCSLADVWSNICVAVWMVWPDPL